MTDLIARVEVAEITATVETKELTAQVGFTAPVMPDYFAWRQEHFDPYFHLPLNDPPGSTVAKALAGPDGVHVRYPDYPPITVYPDSAPEPAMMMEPMQDEWPFPVCGAPSVIPGYPHYTSTRYRRAEGHTSQRGADTYAGDNETFSFVNRTGVFTICWWAVYAGPRDWGPSTAFATGIDPGFTSEVRRDLGGCAFRLKNQTDQEIINISSRFYLPIAQSSHFCAIGDGELVRFYVNGVQISNSRDPLPLYDGPHRHALMIAGRGSASGDVGGLLIDTRPWTPEEVQMDYLRGMGVWE